MRAWFAVCWLVRRQFFSWAAADCGDDTGLPVLTALAEFTRGVEGRDDEGPGEPGDAGSEILFATWLHPLPPPPPAELDKHEPQEAPAPNGALQRTELLICHWLVQLIYYKNTDLYLLYVNKRVALVPTRRFRSYLSTTTGWVGMKFGSTKYCSIILGMRN